jgi:hypothetical protein
MTLVAPVPTASRPSDALTRRPLTTRQRHELLRAEELGLVHRVRGRHGRTRWLLGPSPDIRVGRVTVKR